MNDFSNQLSQYVLSQINQQIEQSVKENLRVSPVTLDVKGLAAMTHMSTSFLYKSVIDTPEFLLIENDLGTKRLWDAEKARKAWKDYMNRHGKPGIERLPKSLKEEII